MREGARWAEVFARGDMPYQDSSFGFELGPFYNLDTSVGLCRGNLRGDVLMVQYFLRKVFRHPMGVVGSFGLQELVVDGICGPITRSYINAFQTAMLKLGKTLKADGNIDSAPADGPKFETYTIWHLERAYCDLWGHTGGADPYYANDAPSELKANIHISVVETKGGGV